MVADGCTPVAVYHTCWHRDGLSGATPAYLTRGLVGVWLLGRPSRSCVERPACLPACCHETLNPARSRLRQNQSRQWPPTPQGGCSLRTQASMPDPCILSAPDIVPPTFLSAHTHTHMYVLCVRGGPPLVLHWHQVAGVSIAAAPASSTTASHPPACGYTVVTGLCSVSLRCDPSCVWGGVSCSPPLTPVRICIAVPAAALRRTPACV